MLPLCPSGISPKGAILAIALNLLIFFAKNVIVTVSIAPLGEMPERAEGERGTKIGSDIRQSETAYAALQNRAAL